MLKTTKNYLNLLKLKIDNKMDEIIDEIDNKTTGKERDPLYEKINDVKREWIVVDNMLNLLERYNKSPL